jgi:hypothetical protein
MSNVSKERKRIAKFLAMCVRNNMEDFHCEHLSDEQMRELNPLIRDAIYTGLHALEYKMKKEGHEKDAATQFVNFQCLLIPKYWEDPKFMKDYAAVRKMAQKEPLMDFAEELEEATSREIK